METIVKLIRWMLKLSMLLIIILFYPILFILGMMWPNATVWDVLLELIITLPLSLPMFWFILVMFVHMDEEPNGTSANPLYHFFGLLR